MNTMRGAVGVVLTMVFALGLVMPAWSGITNYTWDASGGAPLDDGPGAWNATGGNNWFNSTNSTYGAWGNTINDQATFGSASGAAGTITVGAGGVTANKIQFNAPASGSYTLTGGTITMAGSTPTIALAANVTGTVSSVIAGTAGLTFAPTASGTLTLTAANTYSGGTTLNSSGAALGTTYLLSGTNAAFGSGNITAANARSIIASVGALNGSRTITNNFAFGGNGVNFGSSFDDRIVISGTFTPAATDVRMNSGQVLTLNGPLSGANTFQPGQTAGSKVILNGDSSAYSAIVKLQPNTLVAGQASALGTGSITFNGGTLEYGAGVTTDFSSRFPTTSASCSINTGGNNVTFNSAITPSSVAQTFTKAGDGTLTLNSATASTFTNGISLWGGTLLLDFVNMGTPTDLLASNQLNLYGGTLSVLGKSSVTTTQAFGTLNLATVNVTGNLIVNNHDGAGTTLNFSGINRNSGTTLNIDLSNGGTVNNSAMNANSTYRYMTVKDVTASGFVRVDASKNLVRLTSANQTTVTASNGSTGDYLTSGTLIRTVSSLNTLGDTLTLDATSGDGSLNLGGTGFQTRMNSVALIGNNNYTISNGNIIAANDVEHQFFTLGSGTLTLASTLQFDAGAAAYPIIKSGAGTLLINGANSGHTGVFNIDQGTVAIGNSAALGATSATVNIAGDSILSARAAGLTVAQAVTFLGSFDFNQKRMLTLNAETGNDMTLSGAVTGHGGFIKTGAGTVTLSNTGNTYSGGTRLDAGTLSISDSRNLGNRNYNQTVFNGGTLQITGTTLTNLNSNYINWDSFNGGLDIADAANTFTVNSPIGGAGSLVKSGAGKLVLAGANTFTGTLAVSNGTLQVTGSLANSGLSIASGMVLKTGSLDLTGKTLTIDATATSGLLDVTGSLTRGGNLVVLNATTDQKIAQWTGSVSGSFSSAPLPTGFILKVVNGNELWVMKQRGTLIIME